MTDKQIIRELAKQYMELVHSEKHQRAAKRMLDTNDLKVVRPPVLVDEIPWYQMDMDGELACRCEDPRVREMEGYFRRHLRHLFEAQMPALREDLPRDFILYQLSVGFSETVKWWVADNFKNTPEEVADWFWRLYSGEK